MGNTALRKFSEIAVIGAGAWGTALAHEFAGQGKKVRLWSHRAETAAAIKDTRRNQNYLPDVALSAAVTPTADLDEALAGCELIVLATPSHVVPEFAAQIAEKVLGPPIPLVLASKGFDEQKNCLLSKTMEAALPGMPLAIMSGPSFAAELARGWPTAVTLALNTEHGALGPALMHGLSSAHFRLYLSDDPIGVQVAGAVKNVIAIACGIAAGRGYGANAQAALLTRGLAEISRLAVTMGGRAETMLGLAGLGDLSLTCSHRQSRNFSYGFGRGEGLSHEAVMAGRPVVVEGIGNARAVHHLAKDKGIDMPIVEAVFRVLHEGASINDVIGGLLTRPLRAESGSWS